METTKVKIRNILTNLFVINVVVLITLSRSDPNGTRQRQRNGTKQGQEQGVQEFLYQISKTDDEIMVAAWGDSDSEEEHEPQPNEATSNFSLMALDNSESDEEIESLEASLDTIKTHLNSLSKEQR